VITRLVSLMADPAVHLRIAGCLLLALAVSHLVLPRALGWPAELRRVSVLTRQVSYVHTYFIGMLCGLFGVMAVALAPDLLRPDHLAVAILLGAVTIWGSRLFIQIWVFDPVLWNGRALTVVGHLAFVVLWSYLTFVFAWALSRQF